MARLGLQVKRGSSGRSTGKSEFVFDVRMGQTAGFGYAPNERWPHTFLATAFDLANPPGTNGKDGPVSVTTQWFV